MNKKKTRKSKAAKSLRDLPEKKVDDKTGKSVKGGISLSYDDVVLESGPPPAPAASRRDWLRCRTSRDKASRTPDRRGGARGRGRGVSSRRPGSLPPRPF